MTTTMAAKMAELAAGFMSEDKKNEDDSKVIATVGGEEVYDGDMTACTLTTLLGTRLGLLLFMGADLERTYDGDQEELVGMTGEQIFFVATFQQLATLEAVYRQAVKYGLIDDGIKAAAEAAVNEFHSYGMDEIFASIDVSEYAMEKVMLMNILMAEMADLMKEKGVSDEQIDAVAAETLAASQNIEILDEDYYFGIDEKQFMRALSVAYE